MPSNPVQGVRDRTDFAACSRAPSSHDDGVARDRRVLPHTWSAGRVVLRLTGYLRHCQAPGWSCGAAANSSPGTAHVCLLATSAAKERSRTEAGRKTAAQRPRAVARFRNDARRPCTCGWHLRLVSSGFPGWAQDAERCEAHAPGRRADYEQQVADGLDDYYAGRGESPGLWAGTGADGLGLLGVVEDGGLGTLLRGVDPATRKELRAPVRERLITVRTLDVESGEWRDEEKRLAPVSGYDLVFSCPKSVSVLHALTGDERVRREISEAHDASWQAAVAYLEQEGLRGPPAVCWRRGREHGEGFVAAAFRHRTSRARDLHLHTHVIVANMTHTADGEQVGARRVRRSCATYQLSAGLPLRGPASASS